MHDTRARWARICAGGLWIGCLGMRRNERAAFHRKAGQVGAVASILRAVVAAHTRGNSDISVVDPATADAPLPP